MSNYENTPHKIRTTFERIAEDAIALQQKENNLNKFFLSRNYTKHNNVIADTGLVAITPTLDSGHNHPTRGTLTPMRVQWSYEATTTIPREMLPFIEFETRFKTTPDRTLTTLPVYYSDTYTSNYYRVTGDGSKIWSGTGPPTGPGSRITQAYIDDGRVLESHTKPVWIGSIEWTDDFTSIKYRILNAEIVAFASHHYETAVNCAANVDYKQLIGSVFYDTVLSLPKATILDISGNNLTLKGQEVHIFYTDPGGGCVPTTTRTENVTKTFDINEFDALTFYGSRQRWTGSAWVTDPSGGNPQYLSVVTNSSTILSFSGAVSPTSLYLTWDTENRWLFYIFLISGNPTLGNIPVSGLTNGPVALPYTTVEFEVNPDDFPGLLSDTLVVNSQEEMVPRGETPRLTGDNSEAPIFFRTSKSNEDEKYLVQTYFSGNVIAPANTLASTSTFKDWDDIYTVVGSTFSATTTNHTTKDRHFYAPTTNDMWYQVKTSIVNPFYWKETKRIEKGIS